MNGTTLPELVELEVRHILLGVGSGGLLPGPWALIRNTVAAVVRHLLEVAGRNFQAARVWQVILRNGVAEAVELS